MKILNKLYTHFYEGTQKNINHRLFLYYYIIFQILFEYFIEHRDVMIFLKYFLFISHIFYISLYVFMSLRISSVHCQ